MDNTVKVSLSLDLVNATLEYLGKQPYVEVFLLVSQIQKEASESIPKEPKQQTE